MSKLTITLELPNTSKKELISHLVDWVSLLLEDGYVEGELSGEESKGKWTSDYEK